MENIVNIIAQKASEIEAFKIELEKKIVQKASQEEIDALKSSLSSVTQQLDALNQQLSMHATLIESMRVEPTPPADSIEQARLEIQNSIKQLSKKEPVKIERSIFEIRKALTATYPPYSKNDYTLKLLPGSNTPYISELFLRNSITPAAIDYLDMTLKSVSVADSNADGCFPVPPSALNLVRRTNNATTFRAKIDICDTILEDIPRIEEELSNMLESDMMARMDNIIISRFNSIGTPQNLTPSWTALANLIPQVNIMDIAHIHASDIMEISNGMYKAAYMILNPVDYARYITAKSQSYVAGNSTNIQFFQSTTVVPGTYYVVASDAAEVYPVREFQMKLVDDVTNASDGILSARCSMRANILVKNIAVYGIVFGSINAAITNYLLP